MLFFDIKFIKSACLSFFSWRYKFWKKFYPRKSCLFIYLFIFQDLRDNIHDRENLEREHIKRPDPEKGGEWTIRGQRWEQWPVYWLLTNLPAILFKFPGQAIVKGYAVRVRIELINFFGTVFL